MISQRLRLKRSTRSVSHDSAGRMRGARMLVHELLERRALGRPPRGVVLGAGLRPERHVDAHLLQPRDVRLDLRHRIQRIVLAVDDVERRVDEVVAVHLAVGAVVGIAKHREAAVERQVRRPRVRLLQRHVIDAGAAVGNAGEVDLRLVDVVLALQRIDGAQDVVDLLFIPPLRGDPAARMQIDLLLALDAVRRAAAPAWVGGPAPARSATDGRRRRAAARAAATSAPDRNRPAPRRRC